MFPKRMKDLTGCRGWMMLPGNAILLNGAVQRANREIGVPKEPHGIEASWLSVKLSNSNLACIYLRSFLAGFRRHRGANLRERRARSRFARGHQFGGLVEIIP